jgi:hypothetical protein
MEKKSPSLSPPEAQEDPAAVTSLNIKEIAFAWGCRAIKAGTRPPAGGLAVGDGPGWNVTETPPALNVVGSVAGGTLNV